MKDMHYCIEEGSQITLRQSDGKMQIEVHDSLGRCAVVSFMEFMMLSQIAQMWAMSRHKVTDSITGESHYVVGEHDGACCQ